MAQLTAWAQQAAALSQEYVELASASGEQIVSLTERSDANRRLIRRVRRTNRWLVASVAADIVLSVVLGLSLLQVSGNDHRIDQITQRLDVSQTVTRRDTLCPLYTLLKAGETKAARDAAPDKVAFDRSAAVINQGYTALDCAQFIHSPAPSPSPS
jgi:hypothetical protein